MPFRIRSVLAASDLSEGAPEVLRTAGALAALTGAQLHVVHAGGTAGREEAARELEAQAARAVPRAVRVTSSHVAAGRAHEVILSRAEAVDADLLVIGPHRKRPEVRQVLGTTADRLVRTTDVPCLIVHGALSLPLRRVLIPSDLSDASQGALDVALIWAAALRMPKGTGARTRVEVLNVLAPTPSDGAGASGATEAGRALREQVSAAGERTGCAALLEVEPRLVEGEHAADEILRRVHEGGVDLLVLGTHGQSGLSRALIGSVSSAVARRAESPVLLVPPALWKARQAREAQVAPAIPGHPPAGADRA